VVQFAKGKLGGRSTLFALKFFISRAAFLEEQELYEEYPEELRKFMPVMLGVQSNVDGSIQDPHGNPLPPCIVMEKGISLRDRVNAPTANTFTKAQARTLMLCTSLLSVLLLPVSKALLDAVFMLVFRLLYTSPSMFCRFSATAAASLSIYIP
jgi:hypothetical protein